MVAVVKGKIMKPSDDLEELQNRLIHELQEASYSLKRIIDADPDAKIEKAYEDGDFLKAEKIMDIMERVAESAIDLLSSLGMDMEELAEEEEDDFGFSGDWWKK